MMSRGRRSIIERLASVASSLGQKQVTVSVRADATGVTLHCSNDVDASFRWDEVDEIQTFKRDLFAVDQICLAFSVGDRWIELWESDVGFSSVVELMQHRFPIASSWYFEVMQPPFATNQRTLWKRAGVSATSLT